MKDWRSQGVWRWVLPRVRLVAGSHGVSLGFYRNYLRAMFILYHNGFPIWVHNNHPQSLSNSTLRKPIFRNSDQEDWVGPMNLHLNKLPRLFSLKDGPLAVI